MKRNRGNLSVRPRRQYVLALKFLLSAAIISLALFLFMGYIWRIVKTSDYFNVSEIIARNGKADELSYLVGRNIFSIDLKRESEYILESFPDHSKIKLIRIPPNRIFADFLKRQPVALVKLYRYFALDEDGVLFFLSRPAEETGLPVITGLDTKIFGPKPGRKYENKEVLLAIEIIKEAKKNRFLKGYAIKRIEVASPAKAAFILIIPQAPSNYVNKKGNFLPESLEVKIGQENIRERVTILGGLLNQSKGDLSAIKYIDLRFNEPVIKFKDAK